MAKIELRTLGQILDSIMSLLKLQSTDTVSRNRIKGDVTRAYLNEIMPYSSWAWRRRKIQVQAQAYHSTGTASVTQNSVAVVLTTSLSNSRAGYFFSVTGENDVYTIKSHVGGTGTLVLDTPYINNTAATASFKIWTDSIPLPTDLEEITQVTTPQMSRPLEGVGLQELRRISTSAPKGEGRPYYISLDDWVDPAPYSTIATLPATATRASDGLVRTLRFASTLGATTATALLKAGDRIQITGGGSYAYNIEAIVSGVTTTSAPLDTITYTALEPLTEASTADTSFTIKLLNTESYERQKKLLVYPAIYNTRTNLVVDYDCELPALDSDDDEPVMPLPDRIVLFWLGLSYAYARERNPEESMLYRQLAEQRLAKMAGRTTESKDKPSIVPSRLYLSAKRNMQRFRTSGRGGLEAFGAGGSSTNPLGNVNTVAVFGTDQTLQSDGQISTTELHALDGISASSTIEARLLVLENATTTVGLTDNATTTVVSYTAATYNAVRFDYYISRGASNVGAGSIFITHDGSAAAIAASGAEVGTLGVTFSADVNGSDLRLRAALTSTGTGGSIKYRAYPVAV